jgi:uncharacterized protein YbjT (DUF2867 family)
VRILVAGATGFVGRRLSAALDDGGHEVMAGTRDPGRYRGTGEPVALDVGDRASVEAALDGCDAAYYLVHSMAGAGSGSDFEERDRAAATAFAEVVGPAGPRVVYLGGLGAEDNPSPHLRSRHEVGRILRECGDTIELRAAMVIGRGGASFEILRQLVERLPVMVCPRWVTTRCQPIAVDDVVRYLVASLDLPAGCYDVGGPDVLNYEQMLRRFAALTGRKRLILKVPVLTPTLSAHWIGLVTDQPASIGRPLAEGLAAEMVADDERIRSLLPFELLGFDEAVRLALSS